MELDILSIRCDLTAFVGFLANSTTNLIDLDVHPFTNFITPAVRHGFNTDDHQYILADATTLSVFVVCFWPYCDHWFEYGL